MLVAENEIGGKIDLTKLSRLEIEDQRKISWYCPGCGSEVIIKNGLVMRPHFSHKQCQSCDSFSENESEEHLLGKEVLAKNCDKFGLTYELEAYLPSIQQRPDILVEGNIAVEFQCSTLSIKRLKERTSSYLQNGYQVIWLLGNNLSFSGSLSELQKQFIFFSPEIGFYLWGLSGKNECIELTYFLSKTPLKWQFKRESFSLNKHSIVDILSCPKTMKKKEMIETDTQANYDKQQEKWNQQLVKKQPGVMRLQSFFYSQGENLGQLNQLYFYPSFLSPLMMEEEYLFRFLVYQYFLLFKAGTLEEILSYVKKEYDFESFTLVERETLLRYCLSIYLCFLKGEHIIEVENECYSYKEKLNNSLKNKKEFLWLPLKYVMISK